MLSLGQAACSVSPLLTQPGTLGLQVTLDSPVITPYLLPAVPSPCCRHKSGGGLCRQYLLPRQVHVLQVQMSIGMQTPGAFRSLLN